MTYERINDLKLQCAGEHRVSVEPTAEDYAAEDAWAYRPGERIAFCVLPMGHRGHHTDAEGTKWKRLLIADIKSWSKDRAPRRNPLTKGAA